MNKKVTALIDFIKSAKKSAQESVRVSGVKGKELASRKYSEAKKELSRKPSTGEWWVYGIIAGSVAVMMLVFVWAVWSMFSGPSYFR